MTKKIISILGLVGIAFIMITPFLIVRADTGNITPGAVPEQCTIRRDFSAGGITFVKGNTV